MTQVSLARKHTYIVNTGNPTLDSLLTAINRRQNLLDDSIIDRLSADIYVKGMSKNLQLGKTAKYLTNVLPFEAHKDRTTAFEAMFHLNHQDPCQLQFTPIAMRSNYKRGAKYITESFQVLLPIYSFNKIDNNNSQSYVIPFTNEGLKKYVFNPKIDTISFQDTTYILIHFEPRHNHHTLGTGYLQVNEDTIVKAMMFSGRVDFGKVDYFLSFGIDPKTKSITPQRNHVSISYNYAGNKGVNEFDSFIKINELSFKSRKRHYKDKYDLSDIYDKKYDKIDLSEVRPIPLSPEEDSLLSASPTNNIAKKKQIMQRLPEMLVSSSKFNAFGSNMKIYGPLDPASFSYDKINGVTFRQRLQFSHTFHSGRNFMSKFDIGYSFGMKEPRYRTTFETIYNPRKRSGIRITASNRSSGFSSKFKEMVNKVLSDTSDLTFKDLGIAYYRRHEATIEHSYELANGLMMYAGVMYNYRTPVKHGSRAMPSNQISSLVKDHYSDFSPFVRLTWTPRQYYYYQNNQKFYIASYYPTFSLELARSIKGVLGSTSDYGRIELDMQHTIKLDAMHKLSYHIGTGGFLRQKGEYFINYSFFSRGTFPSTWDDHIGGVFTLMNDYWYNSTPAYIQSHVMYESPFLILHKAKPISKYVIKERVYMSHLWAEDKNAYTEIGFGMGNNYFNVGLFSSLIGLKMHEVGVKASIEIDSHW